MTYIEKDESGHFVTKRITKEGPTGLITSGVRELEVRTATSPYMNKVISDSPEQTREMFIAEGEMAAGKATVPDPKIIRQFLASQLWLAAQPTPRVVVPFALALARAVPTGETRMRRDFKQLLMVIKTIAMLNQHHRERSQEGDIIADLSDYKWARELLAPIFRSIVTGGLCRNNPEDV